jgi:hypothetical protein
MLRAALGTEHRLDICRRSYREILAAPVKRPEGAAPKAEGARKLSPGLNGAKLTSLWGDSLPRRGYRTQPRVSTLGNLPSSDSP